VVSTFKTYPGGQNVRVFASMHVDPSALATVRHVLFFGEFNKIISSIWAHIEAPAVLPRSLEN